MSVEGLNRNVVARIRDDQGDTVNVENGALAVIIQDQHSEVFSRHMLRSLTANLPLASPPVVGNYDLTMVAGHGLAQGDEIFLTGNNKALYATVLVVAGDTITLDSPISFTAAVNQLYFFKVTSNMAVDGSTNRLTYKVWIPASQSVSVDVKGIRFHILDNDAMDDAKFGGMTALTRGVVVRKIAADASQVLYMNLKANMDFIIKMDNSSYSAKAPSGFYGFCAELRLEQYGVTIRVEPNEELDIIIQDNLTSLTRFEAMVYGHFVQN